MNEHFSVGWDVGGWNTTKGDAVWIVDSQGKTKGAPRAGSLRELIDRGSSAEQYFQNLFEWCDCPAPPEGSVITLAIDAPLAFPSGLSKLVRTEATEQLSTKAIDNTYLFRKTDAFAAQMRRPARNPLSPLQDQIGSQVTKVLHVLNRLGFHAGGEGVFLPREPSARWDTRIIEAYPAMSKRPKAEGSPKKGQKKKKKKAVAEFVLREPMLSLYNGVLSAGGYSGELSCDQKDALICALTAHLFQFNREQLHQAKDHKESFDPAEGWIWFPKFDAGKL